MTHDPFGPTTDPVAETVRDIANTVRTLDVQVLHPELHDDVLVMLEFMRVQLVAQDERVSKRLADVERRERIATQKERELAVRTKALALTERLQPRRARWSIFRGH